MATGTAGRFASLTNPQFRLLFLGTTLAQLGFGMMSVVQGVVAFDLTGKNSAVGFVGLGMGVAMLLLGPVGGTLSDRLSKRKLLVVSQGVIGLMFLAAGVMVVTGVITIWLLALSTLVLGCMFAMMGPTRQAWVGDMLQGPMLANGVALQQLTVNGTRIVGPPVAGLMIALPFIGSGGTYLVMAALFGMVVGMMAFMEPTPPRKSASSHSVFWSIRDGLRYIWRSRELRLLAAVFMGVVLTGFSYQTVLPGFLGNELGHSTSYLGLMFGCAAVGGIVTSLFLAGQAPRSGQLMFVFGAILAVALFALAFAPGFVAALLITVVIGGASSGFQLLNNVNLMQLTRPEYYGRVMSLTMMAFGFNSVIGYPVGQLADRVGERPTIAGLAVLCLLVVGAGSVALRGVVARARGPLISVSDPEM